MSLLNKATYDLVVGFEGFRSYAYPDGKRYSIGYGNQNYENNRAVQKGDTITKEAAYKLMVFWLEKYAENIIANVGTGRLTINQLGALTSCLYNRGSKAFYASKTYSLVKANPNDAKIKTQFIADWGSLEKAKNGLIKRRTKEVAFYFGSTSLPEPKKQNYIVYAIGLAFLTFLGYKIFNNNNNEEIITIEPTI